MESKRGNIKAFATSATINPTHRERMAGRKCWELGQPHDRDPSSLPSPSLPPPFPPPSRRAHHCPLPIYTAHISLHFSFLTLPPTSVLPIHYPSAASTSLPRPPSRVPAAPAPAQALRVLEQPPGHPYFLLLSIQSATSPITA